MPAQLRVVIPAAGVSRRMSGDTPKQYLPLAGQTVIEWALAPFLKRADVADIVVVLSREDKRFSTLITKNRIRTTLGGAERVESVLRGVQALNADDTDWVLVHDAARPCLHDDDLAKLISEIAADDVGGLLAAPVVDTLKVADAARATATVSREKLWMAFTPQMFRYDLLERALRGVVDAGLNVTDESSAIEHLGLQPKLVQGRSDNIKITVSEDLQHAEFILRQRAR
ncbi:MAG TPA: 2-C-methyl-D-erythritol 4-phosphate cytidylyltransferase [Steroidobacteraceae bacterium]|nr:2-C-methyl-D-erythritol 4-phosphate cytidylyltransferase [Steroidobacteraceae bacterium]